MSSANIANELRKGKAVFYPTERIYYMQIGFCYKKI